MAISISQPERPVHVVVTCANRKRQPTPEHLRIRNLGAEALTERCAAWIDRVAVGSPTVAARDMYAGEHWQVAKNIANAAGPSAKLWVSSAGYGLISADAPIHAYGATFANGQPDSVATTLNAARRWWSDLSEWVGPCDGHPRSFTALAQQNPDSVIIAILSDAYLRACAHDLKGAASQLTDAENIAIFGPSGSCPEIDDLVLPVTAALRSVVGGSLQALNVRSAEYVLRSARRSYTPLRRTPLLELITDVTSAAPEDKARRPAGMRLSDDDLHTFIREQMAYGPTSATKLLRLLRDSGRSCEQGRFKALFAEIASEVLF